MPQNINVQLTTFQTKIGQLLTSVDVLTNVKVRWLWYSMTSFKVN